VIATWVRRRRRIRRDAPLAAAQPLATEAIELRLPVSLFEQARLHVEDVRRGEEAGYLLCGTAHRPGYITLLGREWHPIPSEAIRRGTDGYVSSWQPTINSRVLERAIQLNASVVLVHSHGSDPQPIVSGPDLRNAAQLFPAASRLLGRPAGSVVLGDRAASGRFWQGGETGPELGRLVAVGDPLQVWYPQLRHGGGGRPRLNRQTRAIGPESDSRLGVSSVAVIGVSGGGSHVCQQLAHQGVRRIIPIDDQFVEDVNLGRMIGTTPSDVDMTLKTTVMKRLIHMIDAEIDVDAIPDRFPCQRSLDALKSADVVVACVDRFDVRDQINAFCRRHLLPLVDVGINIQTESEQLRSAYGQVITVLPDSPCLRCTPLLSEAVLAKEQHERPPGYDRNPDALGDPQVVSMNGVLASEAANNVLDLITGYANGTRGAAWWLYDGRAGELHRADLPPHRANCPACAEQALGDPSNS
jgi:molybdopterin/thiamine biosynthesis adenylyltransferase